MLAIVFLSLMSLKPITSMQVGYKEVALYQATSAVSGISQDLEEHQPCPKESTAEFRQSQHASDTIYEAMEA